MNKVITKLNDEKAKKEEQLDFYSLLDEYETINSKIKVLDTRKKEIAKLVKSYASAHGVKNSNGSMFCENDKYVFGQQAKKTVKLNFERAREFFVANKLWDRVKEVKEEINEDKVEELISDGLMTEEDLEGLVDIKTQYAVSIKKKTSSQEEQMEVQKVASIKKPHLIRK